MALLSSDKTILTAHLDEALEKPGCALCTLAAEREYAFLDMFLYGRVNDLATRRELEQSRGFCPRHTQRLLQVGGYGIHAKVAILYRGVVDALALEASALSGRNACLPCTEPCPACRSVEQCEAIYGAFLAERLRSEAFRVQYAASKGLCRRHFHAVFSRAGARVRNFLQSDHLRRLHTLSDDLAEFVRKSVVQTEPFGAERDAWERVIWLCGGNDALPPTTGHLENAPTPTEAESQQSPVD